MKISEIRDGDRNINLEAKVIEIGDSREVKSRYNNETYRVADATIEDETGTMKLSLWNEQIQLVRISDRVKIENGYARSFRGELQLNSGKYGSLTVI